MRKIRLLTLHNQIVGNEVELPDDLQDDAVKARAMTALEGYYDTSGIRIVPNWPQINPAPVSALLLAHDGKEIRRWTVADLANSLGKEPPN